VFGIYFVWFWSHGQTLAMKTWHIRVTDLQGNTISQKRALLRYTLSWVWFLPPLVVSWLFDVDAKVALLLAGSWIPIWAAMSRFHPQKQFWHDAFAGTRLMSFRHPPAKRAS
jgi:uncharacterized RDD family membrane protein YckC